MIDLTFSEIKQVCGIIGCSATELPDLLSDDWSLLSDADADEAAADYIHESLWAFNADFLSGETGIDSEVFKAIQANDRCESNNDAIESIIQSCGSLERFYEAAIAADGRGHFMSSYDGEEHEIGTNLYLYRLN